MEGKMPRCVPGDVEHAKRPDLVALAHAPVDGAPRVLRASECQPDSKRVGGDRTARPETDRLGGAFAGDDVHLPLVRVDERAAELSESRQAPEMRTMRMGHGDVLEVSRRASDPPDA